MQISVYNQKEAQKNWIKHYIFLALLLMQCGMIVCFSSQQASESAELSRNIMEKMDWVPEAIPREQGNSATMGITLHYIIRKLAHLYNFFLVGGVLYVGRSYLDKGFIKDFLWIGFGLLIGALDEFHQHFVPGRCGEIIDVCVDFSGILLGYTFIYALLLKSAFKRCSLWKIEQ